MPSSSSTTDDDANAVNLSGFSFDTDHPKSVETYFMDHPSQRPDALRGRVVLNESGRGAETMNLPEALARGDLSIVLTCGSPTKYRVTALSEQRKEVLVTGGDSCGGPELQVYTWPLAKGPIPRTVKIDVPSGTPLWLTLYHRD